jgi:hypothetical protein
MSDEITGGNAVAVTITRPAEVSTAAPARSTNLGNSQPGDATAAAASRRPHYRLKKAAVWIGFIGTACAAIKGVVELAIVLSRLWQ